MRTILSPDHPENRHYCPLGSTGPYSRTLRQCDECGRWWWTRDHERGPYWAPVRWFHFRLRKRIEQNG